MKAEESYVMKLTVALLSDHGEPLILFEGEALKDSEDARAVQISSGEIVLPDSKYVKVSASLTFSNSGISVLVEQSDENYLNATFGSNYHPTLHFRVSDQNSLYISLDLDEEFYDVPFNNT